MTSRPNRVIRASEVGAYTYCARAWWLNSECQVQPGDLEPLQRGAAAHERHGQTVAVAAGLTRLAYLVLGLALASGALWWLSH